MWWILASHSGRSRLIPYSRTVLDGWDRSDRRVERSEGVVRREPSVLERSVKGVQGPHGVEGNGGTLPKGDGF